MVIYLQARKTPLNTLLINFLSKIRKVTWMSKKLIFEMKWIYLGEYGLWGLRLGGDVRTLHVSRLAKRKRKWLFCVKNGEWCDRNWCIRLHFCEFLTWKKENGGVIRPCKCFEYLFWIAPWLEWLAWHATWLAYEGKSVYVVDIRILSHLWSIYEVYLYMIHEIYAFYMFVF